MKRILYAINGEKVFQNEKKKKATRKYLFLNKIQMGTTK